MGIRKYQSYGREAEVKDSLVMFTGIIESLNVNILKITSFFYIESKK